MSPQPRRRYPRKTVAIAESMSWDAVSALTFITDPGKWPAFVAWAEQLEPTEAWTETDRQRMTVAARYFLDFAEQCERIAGGPANEP